MEECSHDFCDDTLNISLSLGVPQTGATNDNKVENGMFS